MVKKTPLFGRENVKKVLEKAFTLAHVCVGGVRWGGWNKMGPRESRDT